MVRAVICRTVQVPLQCLAEFLSFMEEHLNFKEFIQPKVKVSEERSSHGFRVASSF